MLHDVIGCDCCLLHGGAYGRSADSIMKQEKILKKKRKSIIVIKKKWKITNRFPSQRNYQTSEKE